MANENKPITELPPGTSFGATDLLVYVDMSGTPTTKKITEVNAAMSLGISGYSGFSGQSGTGPAGTSGFSGFSGIGTSGFSGFSGLDGIASASGYTGYSGKSGYSGFSGANPGASGYSGFTGVSGYSGFSGAGTSGYSGFSGPSGYSGFSGPSGYSGFSGAQPTNATFNNQTGTTYTLQSTDNGLIVTCDNGSGIDVTIPSGLGIGFNCMVIQLGAGQVSFLTSSTTLHNRQSQTKIAGQYGIVTLIATTTNVFDLAGDTGT